MCIPAKILPALRVIPGVTIRTLTRLQFSTLWNLTKTIDNHPIDIAHSHSEFGDIVAVFIKLLHWKTIIIRTSHGGHTIEWRKRPFRRILLTNFIYPLLFDLEIGINQATTDYLNHRWITRLLGKQSVQIPNALDLNRFSKVSDIRKLEREALAIPDDSFVIGSVGRLTEQKGFIYLLEAYVQVLRKNQNFTLLIVGEGELRDDLQQIAKRLGIQDHLFLIGARANIEEIYSCFDIFVNSSLWEGLPTVILESMAAGIPVVATDIPGNRAILTHGQDSFLVPPAQPDKLADAILKISEDQYLREKILKNGFETVKSYRIEAIARDHEILYQKLYRKKT